MDFLFHIDLINLVKTVGYLGIFFIIFAESGLLFGFFFPGDSLLFTAGFLASVNLFNIWFLILICFIAAVLGDSTGYYLGKKFGPKIFNKEDSFWFRKKHLKTASDFYKKHGGKTIILARFTPIIRTFAPVVAGAGAMNYQAFITYNLVGGFLWAVGITFGGYYLGTKIPNVDKYLLPIVILIILVSLLPTLFHLFRERFLKT